MISHDENIKKLAFYLTIQGSVHVLIDVAVVKQVKEGKTINLNYQLKHLDEDYIFENKLDNMELLKFVVKPLTDKTLVTATCQNSPKRLIVLPRLYLTLANLDELPDGDDELYDMLLSMFYGLHTLHGFCVQRPCGYNRKTRFRVIHSDIKLANMFLVQFPNIQIQGRRNAFAVVLGDFDLTLVLLADNTDRMLCEYTGVAKGHELRFRSHAVPLGPHGTRGSIAPELVNNEAAPSDVYSMGIAALEMVMGKPLSKLCEEQGLDLQLILKQGIEGWLGSITANRPPISEQRAKILDEVIRPMCKAGSQERIDAATAYAKLTELASAFRGKPKEEIIDGVNMMASAWEQMIAGAKSSFQQRLATLPIVSPPKPATRGKKSHHKANSQTGASSSTSSATAATAGTVEPESEPESEETDGEVLEPKIKKQKQQFSTDCSNE